MSGAPAPVTVHTTSVEATRAVAAALAALAGRGDLVLLVGELGAGKTAFVQGFAAAFGATEPVTSPTFTLVHEYRGRCPIHHLDVYRLERLAELADVGLAELLDDGGITLIEWGDAIASALPADYLEVHFGFGDGDDDRRLRLRGVGSRWSARWRRVLEGLEPWRC